MNATRTISARPWLRLGVFGLLVAVAFAGMLLGGRARVTTDLFALLPQEDRDPLLGAAMAQSRDAFFDQVDVVVYAPLDSRDAAGTAATAVAAALREAPLLLHGAAEQQAALGDFYRADPFQWLREEDRRALEQDAAAAFRGRLAANLARPGKFNTADPAGFVDAWLGGLPSPGSEWTLVEDFPARVAHGTIAIYLGAQLTEDPMRADVQAALDHAIEAARESALAACPECELHWTGAVRYSEATRLAAENDIERLSGFAMFGIIALFALAFRSVRPLGAAITILGGGVLAGLTASFAVFGSLHALTLVFGTTLLGLSVDYVLHYLVHRWAHPEHDAAQTFHAVRPGLLLGLVTSMSAFLFLLFAGFPALSQLAVFSATGLLAAFGLVALWLPHALNGPDAGNFLARTVGGGARLPSRARTVALGLLCVGALAGIPGVHVVDDVRGLQAAPDDLVADDARVRELTQGLPGRQGADFLLVPGDTLDAALHREANLFTGQPEAFGLSRFLLPRDIRRQNIDAWAPLFEGSPSAAENILAAFGFAPGIAADLEAAWRQSRATPSEQLLDEPALAQLRPLASSSEAGIALIARAPEAIPVDGVRRVQPLDEVQATFGAIRVRALAAVAAAYLLMLFVLSRRYGFGGALRVLSPALLGAGCAVGLLGLAGLPLNVFSLVALILVLGIGADYALFLREGSEWPDTARLATGLAAVTSLLSFGLLVFSNLPALRAFGFAAAAGILTAWLAAPLAMPHRIPARAETDEELVHDRAA